MSASASTLARKLPRDSRLRAPEPFGLKLVELGIGFPALGLVVVMALLDRRQIAGHAVLLLAWTAVIAAVDLLPVRYTNHQLTMSVAILLAAGMVLSVGEVGILALVGSIDPRELRCEVTPARSIFNRGQIALSSMAAAAVFHVTGGHIRDWPRALVSGGLAAATDAAINLAVVSVGHVAAHGRRMTAAFRYLFQEMLIEAPWEATVGYLGLTSLALLFAAAYSYQGLWGLLAALVPVGLVRQSFAHRRSLIRVAAEVANKSRLLEAVGQNRLDELREERRRVAGDLHDEVLPALFKVHLMGQVIKLDLESGRLLDLDDDLIQLLHATDSAAEEMRSVISSLRRTSMEPGGVTPTLQLLAKDLQRESSAVIHVTVEDVGGSPLIQLLVFQVAREALRNAVKHARANTINVDLRRDGRDAVLRVQDDGCGMDSAGSSKHDHFGLDLMRERVRMAGGDLTIVSHVGIGTTVIARFPQDIPTS